MSLPTTSGPIFEVDHPAYVTTEGTRVEMPWGHLQFFTGRGAHPSETTVGLCTINPGEANPIHYHPNCEETIYVMSGRCAHLYGRETVTLEPAQTILVPRNVVHQARALGDEPLVLMIVFSSGEREAVFLEG